ncbi:MAG: LysM peptidoglycan-binding domain-containing protein [Chloroflexi bacterium]|nr:LysM peptidoglycan-binding domain-containing protein [Chloroflexota bacterium]
MCSARRLLSLSVDEQLARRLAARAAALGVTLDEVMRRDLLRWLGDWGLRFVTHIVRPGETLSGLAMHYYGDPSAAQVIAAFNALDDPDLIHADQLLRIPEVGTLTPLPAGESPYLFGLHDRGGEHLMGWAGRKGWVVITEELGADADDWSSCSYADLAAAGYGVIVRLNHGYGEKGTLPHSERYADFARRCGNFVERSQGCHIWIIANEPNLAVERPGGPVHGQPITPTLYAQAFRLCREEILRRPGHAYDQVLTAAIGPWNVQTAYPGNPSGDWIIYFQDMLRALNGELDGIALHTYARSPDPAEIVSELRMDPPFEHRRKMFRTYIDFMEAIPEKLRHLPVYITETDQNVPWLNQNNGWVQQAYAEIDRWNADVAHQAIRALVLYRWERHDMWAIRDKEGVIADFRAALAHEYRWHERVAITGG